MSTPSLADRLRGLIVDNIEGIGDASGLTSEAKLAEPGMDSVSGLNLLLAMEEEFAVKFSEELLTNDSFESCGSLEAALLSLGAK